MNPKPMREFRLSLRARTTSWYVGLLAVALSVFSIAIYVGLRTYLKNTLQLGLSGTAHTIQDDFLKKLPAKGEAWVLGEIRESFDSSPGDHYVRLSVGTRVLYQTADMKAPSIRIGAISLPVLSDVGTYHRQIVEGHDIMIYSLPFRRPDGQVWEAEAGTSLFPMQQTLHSLTKILAVATVLILILATMGGYLLMERPLRPLVTLTDKAANIGRKELGERLPVIPTGDELERLTHSLNGMIDRLEDALNHNHRFSADASHELRTPLTIMRGELEEILRLEELPQQAVENLVSILEETERMSRIVNSLMIITRLDAGGERMDREVLNLSALTKSTTEHLRLLAEEKGLPLSCTCDAEIYVYADPLRIKQVLVNLIDNAIKYSQPEGMSSLSDQTKPVGGVEVTVAKSDSVALLTISDKGIGMARDVIPLVFDRFYRADFARSRGAGGVGLGLAIVKAIVTAHDGTVTITSVQNEGTEVRVQLPLLRPPPQLGKQLPVLMRS